MIFGAGQVFLFGGLAASQMPLIFVDLEYRFDCGPQRGIYLFQRLGNIFMYRTFADAEPLCCSPHGRLVFQHIPCQLFTAFITLA